MGHLFIQLSPSMRLFSAYEIEYLYFYLEHLFRSKTENIKTALRRLQTVDIERLNGMINPKLAQMRKRKNKKNGMTERKGKKNELLSPIDPKSKCDFLLCEAQRFQCL